MHSKGTTEDPSHMQNCAEVPLISFIVPVLNEEANVERLYETVTEVMRSVEDRYRYEILFTDNHSEDRTYQLLCDLASTDSRVRVLRFSRNFGFQASILTGYLNAKGDAVVQLDCDLQDPPSMALDFLRHWEEGYKVVYGIRIRRKEGFGITLARKIFYRFLNYLSEHPIPVDAGDFRLVDKRIVDEMRRVKDATPYLRGMIACMGFDQIGIPYSREARTAGESKFRFRDLLKLAIDGILNHSIVPLRLGTLLSQVIGACAIAVLATYAIARLTVGSDWPAGFATISILILLSTALNAFLLGIQGEYIGRIFKQVKQFPITIVESSRNDQVESEPRCHELRKVG